VKGDEPEPPMKPPPWIQTIAGSFALGGALAGRQTFRYRQSSDEGRGAGAPGGGGGPKRPCMQSDPNSAACRTPAHGATGWGGRHRSSPRGGAAKGIPLKDATSSVTTPCSSPLSTRTTGSAGEAAGACEDAAAPAPIAAGQADTHRRSAAALQPARAPSSRSARMPRLSCSSLRPFVAYCFPGFVPKTSRATPTAVTALGQPA
jgi:hypothetical protein